MERGLKPEALQVVPSGDCLTEGQASVGDPLAAGYSSQLPARRLSSAHALSPAEEQWARSAGVLTKLLSRNGQENLHTCTVKFMAFVIYFRDLAPPAFPSYSEALANTAGGDQSEVRWRSRVRGPNCGPLRITP